MSISLSGGDKNMGSKKRFVASFFLLAELATRLAC